jgi:hypothetical protein
VNGFVQVFSVLSISMLTNRSDCLGYYVAAGIPIQIDVLEQIGATGWSARIGCHSDDLVVSIRDQLCHRTISKKMITD